LQHEGCGQAFQTSQAHALHLREVHHNIGPAVGQKSIGYVVHIKRTVGAPSAVLNLDEIDDMKKPLQDPKAQEALSLRWLEEYEQEVAKGVRTGRPTRKQTAKAEKGLSDLYEKNPNAVLQRHQELSWEAYEGTYERCLRELRLHYMRSVCRDIADLYGPRKFVTLEQMEKQQELNEKAEHRIQLLAAMERSGMEYFGSRKKGNQC
jgi:hypothetical protein